MNKTTAGWVVFVAAIGMMLGLLSVDVSQLKDLCEAYSPGFIGSTMGHISVVITAFIGGKLIPESRTSQLTRSSDLKMEGDK
jgi:hypothetical protein